MSAEYRYTLTYNATPTVLDISPAGWENLGLEYARNRFYHGVFLSTTLSVKFPYKRNDGQPVEGGGQIILDAFDADGIEAEVHVLIEKYNPNTNDYDTFYTGILDFSPNKWTVERDFVEIAIISTSKEKKFLTRDEINYNLRSTTSQDGVTVPSFSISPSSITIPKVDIILQALTSGNFDHTDRWTSPGIINPNFDPSDAYYLSTSVTINSIGDRLKIQTRDELIYENSTSFDTEIKIFSSIISDTSTLRLNDLTIQAPSTAYMRLVVDFKYLVLDADDNLVQLSPIDLVIFEETGWGDVGTPLFLDVNLDAPGALFLLVPAGGRVLLKKTYTPTGIWGACEVLLNDNMNVNVNITEISPGQDDSTVDSFFIHEAFTRAISLATSETDTSKIFYSEKLGRTDSEFISYASNGEGGLDVVTNGFALRGFPARAINVNIKDLFQTFTSIYSLGLGYDRTNERFFIDDIGAFYNKNELFNLGEVKDLKITDFDKGYFNDILAGTDADTDYEDIEGVNEFNTLVEYAISVPVKNKLNVRSAYNTDTIGAEITRRKQFSENSSLDTKRDDTIFAFRTDGSSVIQGSIDGNATGFLGIEERYNFAFLPRENIIRQAGLLRSALWKKTSPFVQFIKSKIKTEITYTNQNYDVVNEFDDIVDTELNRPKLFNPRIYKFSAPINQDLITILNSNPHGFIKFNFDGVIYEGFVDRIVTKDYEETAEFELIAKDLSTGGDLKNFENDEQHIFEDDVEYQFEING